MTAADSPADASELDALVEQTDNSADVDAPDVPQSPDWRPW